MVRTAWCGCSRLPSLHPVAVTRRRALAPARVAAVVVASAVGVSLLAGCAQRGTGTRPAASEGTTTSSPAPSASSSTAAGATTAASTVEEASAPSSNAAPFPANTDPDTGEASADARVTVSDVRVGRQDGFDRVVFEVAGTGTPGWRVEYVDSASAQGSGAPVDVAGDAVLQVTLTGAGYPYDTGVEEFPTRTPVRAAGTRSVTEVVFGGTFEGTSEAFVGTTGRTPFRAYALSNPARVVVEVADS